MEIEEKIKELSTKFLDQIGWTASYTKNACIKNDGSFLPWYNYAVIDFLEKRLPQNISVFEFGCGYSTLFYSKRTNLVISVETNKQWAKSIIDIATQQLVDNIEIHVIEDPSKMKDTIDAFHMKFELIVVDSLNRNDCIISSYNSLTKDGVIILDNTERDNYGPSFNFLSSRGFKNLSFSGIGPLRTKIAETTLFYRIDNIMSL